MTQPVIQIFVDARQITDAFDRLVQGLRNTTPLMQEVSFVMDLAVSENFEQGGRPKWLGKWDGTPSNLQDSGRLRNSIVREYDQANAVVGTNVVYAGIHNFGGTIRPKTARALYFNGRAVAQVQMPKREFLMLTPSDMDEIEEVGLRYLQSLVD